MKKLSRDEIIKFANKYFTMYKGDIKSVSYFEYNGIDLNNKKSIGDIFCNYGNPYKNPDGIKSDFEKIDNLIEEKRNSVLGRYGELEIYNMLKANLKLEEEIKWVSKDVGDLFGYDIIISSPLLRAFETGRIISQNIGYNIPIIQYTSLINLLIKRSKPVKIQ